MFRMYCTKKPLMSLNYLFWLSISQRYVPLNWKIGAVTPLPKIKNPSANDLRPISMLPTPMKLLETMVLQGSRKHFVEAFDKEQFRFRFGSSTTCTLVFLEECVSRYLDDNSTLGVAIVSYDLSKAFDKIPHDVILQRLVDLSFPHGLIQWISSYLRCRQQFVQVGVHRSTLQNITSGVPQESILGPFLFVATVGSYSSNSDSHVIK